MVKQFSYLFFDLSLYYSRRQPLYVSLMYLFFFAKVSKFAALEIGLSYIDVKKL